MGPQIHKIHSITSNINKTKFTPKHNIIKPEYFIPITILIEAR